MFWTRVMVAALVVIVKKNKKKMVLDSKPGSIIFCMTKTNEMQKVSFEKL